MVSLFYIFLGVYGSLQAFRCISNSYTAEDEEEIGREEEGENQEEEEELIRLVKRGKMK